MPAFYSGRGGSAPVLTTPREEINYPNHYPRYAMYHTNSQNDIDAISHLDPIAPETRLRGVEVACALLCPHVRLQRVAEAKLFATSHAKVQTCPCKQAQSDKCRISAGPLTCRIVLDRVTSLKSSETFQFCDILSIISFCFLRLSSTYNQTINHVGKSIF